MFLMIFILMMLLSFSSLFLIMNFILSKKIKFNREKNSSFECGFDPLMSIRIPFKIQFFLISLIFLIFDIEISLFIPFIFSIQLLNFFMIFTLITFLILLILSIYLEYLENMLEWKN